MWYGIMYLLFDGCHPIAKMDTFVSYDKKLGRHNVCIHKLCELV